MESQYIEYKQAWRDEYLKYICAFANAQGGVLYIGVNDDGSIHGVSATKKLLEDIPNQSVQHMGILPDVDLHTKENKEYISIKVTPIDQPISYKGKYYYRSGSTVRDLNGSALQDFLLKKIGRTWDDLICEEATIDDLDPKVFEFFLERAFEAKRMPQEAKGDSMQTILTNLNLITTDGKLRNAAVLLFGKNPQYFFATSNFRIARIGKNDTDLIFQEDINGNILQMAGRVMWQLRSRYLLSRNRYEGLQRIEDLELPENALRELIHNAIVHRNYAGFDTQMKVYDDHIWLWNAGELPQGYTLSELTTGHLSFPRNKRIAEVFYKAGFIESWGRGIQQVNEAFIAAHLNKPTIENMFGGTSIIIPRNTNLSPLNTKKLTERQQIIIDLLSNNPSFSAKTISEKISEKTSEKTSEKMNASDRTIEMDIAALKKLGILQRIGGRKDGYWKVLL